jgi:quinol monooxygenase YgiN
MYCKSIRPLALFEANKDRGGVKFLLKLIEPIRKEPGNMEYSICFTD